MCGRVCSVSYSVRVDGTQAVAVRHTVGGATAAKRMRAERGGARPDEGHGHGSIRRSPGGHRPHFIGRG